MRGRWAGARHSCFSLHGATALLIVSLVIYTYRTFVGQSFSPLNITRKAQTLEEQISITNPQQPAFDADGDGVPDFCYYDEATVAHCLLNDGSWTAIPPGGVLATSTAVLEQTSSPAAASLTVTSDEISAAPSPEDELATATTPPGYGDSAPSEPPSLPSDTPELIPEEPADFSAAPSTTVPSAPAISLPAAHQFKLDNGTKWRIEYVGDIRFTGELATKNLIGDKCRSGQIGDKVIWNCGDMWCDFDYTICGFAMGPAMYGTEDVLVVNTTGIDHIYKWDFLRPHPTDPTPETPWRFWGMDTSNVAPINDTHGVAYANEIWRGSPDGAEYRCGTAVASVTLGEDRPLATRLGPLLTGPGVVEMGMLAILRADNYIYIYSQGGPSQLLVTRVIASDDVFDIANYESLEYGTNSWSSAIPDRNTTLYGMINANPDGQFGCSVYGSVFFNNHLGKYLIICNIDMSWTNMYTSDTPWGPWSEEYGLLHGWTGYGSMAHPEYSPYGNHREFYFSQGPNDQFNMFKVTFDYEEKSPNFNGDIGADLDNVFGSDLGG